MYGSVKREVEDMIDSIVYDLIWCTRPFNNPTNLLLSTRVTQTVYGSVTRFALTTRARQTLLHPSEDSRTSRTKLTKQAVNVNAVTVYRLVCTVGRVGRACWRLSPINCVLASSLP